jgi:hypothetical protein
MSDHVAAMQANIITQFKGQPNLAAFVNAVGAQLNDVEEFFTQILNNLCLENAVGVQLDGLGAALNQGRNGLGDSDYRTLLQARIVSQQATGTIEDMLVILKTLANCTYVSVQESFPAKMVLTAIQPTQPNLTNADILTAVAQAKAAGVGALVLTASAPVFQYDLPATANNAGYDVGHIAGPMQP